ncbi:MAG: ABC transporter ATP-binding protein [Chryseolinea sp.]
MDVIKVEGLSKLYDLGQVGTGTLSRDLNRWWAGVRGKEDPYAKIGKTNDRTKKDSSARTAWALQNINFTVSQGEILGIIGRNGAGKSTLLKIISQITTPSRGTIKIRGRVASLLEVGTGFHPEMTGRENIFLNGTLLGMTKREIARKLDEIIDFAGVALYIDTPVKRYSSGMQVRLGFAVAAFLEPEILIVDEVLAVGDAEFQSKAIGRMQEVSSGQGRTILFVSHNLGAVAQLCKSGLLLENGMVTSHGEIKNVLNDYIKSSRGADTITDRRNLGQWVGQNQFVNFEMINSKMEVASKFMHNEPIILNIDVYLPNPTPSIELAVSLYDRLKNRIFTIHEPMSSFKRNGDLINAKINLPANFLTAGEYSWLMCINRKAGGVEDLHDDFYSFSVVDNGSRFNSYKEGSYGSVFVNYSIGQ